MSEFLSMSLGEAHVYDLILVICLVSGVFRLGYVFGREKRTKRDSKGRFTK